MKYLNLAITEVNLSIFSIKIVHADRDIKDMGRIK